MPNHLHLAVVLLLLSTSLHVGESPTGHTAALNAKVKSSLNFADRSSYEDAARGFIAPLPADGVVQDAGGRIVWNPAEFAFLEADAPDTETACRLDKDTFIAIILGEKNLDDAIGDGTAELSGDRRPIERVLSLNQPFPFWFDLVGK